MFAGSTCRAEESSPRRRMRRAVVILPSGLTLANLFCGVFAIISASRGQFDFAGLLIVMGLVVIGLIEEGRIDTRPWITHRAAFDELIDVFPSYTRPETGVIKAVVEVGE